MEFTIVRGINLTGLFGGAGSGGPPAAAESRELSRADIERIADTGFDHVRILLGRTPLTGSGGGEAAERLLRILAWCDDVPLKAVIAPAPGEAGAEGEREEIDRWTGISRTLGHLSKEMVAYGILNGTGAGSAEAWNERCAGTIRSIRELEPDRHLVVESAEAGNPETLPLLRIPQVEDVILSIRYYRPLLVTHSGIPLSRELRYAGPVRYPGAPIPDREFSALEAERRQALLPLNTYRDRYVIAEELETALERRERRDLPVYCGEFGCSHGLPEEIRKLWLHDLVSVLDRMHIGWAVREYRGPFGVFDTEGNETGILPILMNSSYLK